MGAFSVTVTGDKAVRRRMDAVRRALGGKGLLPPLRAAALVAQNDAKRRAPYLTGTLRRSIHMEDSGTNAVAVGTDVPYARRIEYGFAGTDKRGRTYHQAAQPYLRPALDENKREIRQEFANALRDVLKAAVR